jgi:hypothetical protein
LRLPAVVLVLAAAGAAAMAAPAARKSSSFDTRDVVGLYVIGGHRDQNIWIPAMEVDAVRGVAISEEWTAVEPERGRRDWSVLDDDVRVAARAGRKVGLRLQAGISTPEWVYERGARRFTFEDRNPTHGPAPGAGGGGQGARGRNQSLGQTLTLPVPWDEAFLSAWEGFIAAAGAHYRDEPAIAMVHVTGPNKHSAEMILPRQPEDRQRWHEMGYTEDKLVGAWKRCLDAYARAFPRAALVLNLSPAILDDNAVERVVEYGVKTYGTRLFLQNNILLGDNPRRNRVDWKLLERYRDSAVIGFQREPLRLDRQGVTGQRRTDMRRDNFEKMLEQGMRLGARYFEIGAEEARDFPDVVARYARLLSS